MGSTVVGYVTGAEEGFDEGESVGNNVGPWLGFADGSIVGGSVSDRDSMIPLTNSEIGGSTPNLVANSLGGPSTSMIRVISETIFSSA